MKKKLFVIICLLFISGCTPQNNEDKIIIHSFITGENVHFEFTHERNANYYSVNLNPEDLKTYLIDKDYFLYESNENKVLFYYKMFNAIFHIEYEGQNENNSNLYNYSFHTDEIYILEKYTEYDSASEKDIVQIKGCGYLIFPGTAINISRYFLNEKASGDFSILKTFYSNVPDAVINSENKTITLPLYGKATYNGALKTNEKSDIFYAVIHHDGIDSFEILLEEYEN